MLDYKGRVALFQQVAKKADEQWKGFEEDQVLTVINIRDVTQHSDEKDNENYISHVLVGSLVNHFLFRYIVICAAAGNLVTIALQINPEVSYGHATVVHAFDQIVLNIFIWEIMIKMYYGFQNFWKNNWNTLDVLVTIAVPVLIKVLPQDVDVVVKMLRVVSSFTRIAAIPGVSVMIQVIVRSIPDMGYTILLLGIVMMIFAVIGVTFFNEAHTSAFGDLMSALFTLFICITQDGWMKVYSGFTIEFSEEDRDDEDEQDHLGIRIGAAVFFLVFISVASFIIANIIVTVITTNLEITASEQEENDSSENMTALENPPAVEGSSLDLVARTDMGQKSRRPLRADCLEILTIDTFEELALIIADMDVNQEEYREIREKLQMVVDEIYKLPANQEMEENRNTRNKMAVALQENQLMDELTACHSRDLLTDLMTLEKTSFRDLGLDEEPQLLNPSVSGHGSSFTSLLSTAGTSEFIQKEETSATNMN